MVRLVWLAAALAACGTTEDFSVNGRPLTVAYITEAILMPTCGAAQCHSTFSGNRYDVFDTVVGARSSLVNNGLIRFDSMQYDPATPDQAQLILWVTQTDPLNLGIGRMPFDAPMPNEDIVLLEKWIQAGAVGAQCNPATPMACNNKQPVACGSDWNFGAPIGMPCVNACGGGICQ